MFSLFYFYGYFSEKIRTDFKGYLKNINLKKYYF